jgi:hypothetical protein
VAPNGWAKPSCHANPWRWKRTYTSGLGLPGSQPTMQTARSWLRRAQHAEEGRGSVGGQALGEMALEWAGAMGSIELSSSAITSMRASSI